MSEEATSIFDQSRRVSQEELHRLASSVEPQGESQRPVIAPATDETLGHIPELSPDAVGSAVSDARSAQVSWASRSIEERAEVLRRFASIVLDTLPEILDVIQLETGKSRFDALEEPLALVMTSRYYARYGPSMLADRSRRALIPFMTSAEELFRPKGIVGVISPWNYPLAIPFEDAIPALLAGNAVVIKPDDKTPYSTLLAGNLLAEAGLPRDVLRVVTGDGSTVGQALIEQVDFIAFTGSVEVGRTVGAKAGDRLIDCSLELGGKNPCIVLDDADTSRAAKDATWACFSNAGQLCLSTERIYVEDAVCDDFLDAFVRFTRQLQIDCGLDFTYAIGSLIDESHHASVTRFVDDAVAEGATVLSGGRSRPEVGPFCFEPTILTDVPDSVAVTSEEVFGPVVIVERVEDASEAVTRANRHGPHLHGVVWSGDADRARQLGTQLTTGMVSINDAYFASYGTVDTPMGGITNGGIGHRQGRPGLYRYVDRQAIVQNRGPRLTKPDWLPESAYPTALVWLTRLLSRIPRL